MNRTLRAVALVCAIALMIAALSRGQETSTPVASAPSSSLATEASASTVPHLINFSGAINPQINPQITQITQKETVKAGASTAIGVTFSLYELREGGAPLWVESQKVGLDNQGRYTVLLGSTSPNGLPLDLFTSGKALWLGVQPQLAGVGEQPRTLLVAVPYALKAVDADTLGGKPVSAFVVNESQTGPLAEGITQSSTSGTATQAGGAVSPPAPVGGSGVPGYIPMWITSTLLGDSTIFESGRKVGIGNPRPAATLDVSGNAVVRGTGSFSGTTTTANTSILTVVQNGGENIPPSSAGLPPPAAVVGKVTSPSAFAVGVLGMSSDPNGPAVVGYSTATTGTQPAVVGLATSNKGVGVDGEEIATSGTTTGVYGHDSSPNGNAGFFINDGGGMVIGASNGTTWVFSVDSSGNTHIWGNTQIDGNLNVKGTKNAVQKLPDGRSVALSAMESPENWFEDFGTAELRRGVATVAIDPTFTETVNTAIEYHVFLTPNGNCHGLYVARKTATGFEVRELGRRKSSVKFDYRIVARRRGYEKERLEVVEPMRASR